MKLRIGGSLAAGVALLAFVLPAVPAWARDFKVKAISPESYERLSPEAKVEYEQAYQLADRILYRPALDAAERAIELQPTSVELRYFAIRLANYLADVNLQADAVTYLERAALQCQAILEMEGIPPTLRDRVRADLTKFAERAENVYRRDELRKTWGAEIAKDYVRSAYRKEFEEEREERMESTLQALRDPDARRSLAAQAAARALAAPTEEGGGEQGESGGSMGETSEAVGGGGIDTP